MRDEQKTCQKNTHRKTVGVRKKREKNEKKGKKNVQFFLGWARDGRERRGGGKNCLKPYLKPYLKP